MTQPPARHRIYLLAAWLEDAGSKSGGTPKLRFRLEDPRTGERHGFDGTEALARYLQTELTKGAENNRTESASDDRYT
jgi:hypothetical protein